MMFFRGTGGMGRGFDGGLGFMGNCLHHGGGLLMIGGALLVTILIVTAIVVIVRKSHKLHNNEQSAESLTILDERFVKGEITEEEYTRMKKVLKTK